MPWLTTEGASHQIAEGETTVGSGEGARWRLVSRDLAPRHFVIARRGAEISVRPCTVDGIISVNGSQSGSNTTTLHDGDTIDAGSARFVFSVDRQGSYKTVETPEAHLAEVRGGVIHPLSLQSVGIGRDRLNAIVIGDPTASRFHAEVRKEAGGYVLHPHGSSGTLVNGRRVGSATRLQDGDRIEIANVELKFVLGSPPAGGRRAEQGANDAASQRPTVIQGTAFEIPPESPTRPGRWLWVAAVIVIAGVAWLLLR
jgi:predicted component of type VI protein secretion system